MPTSAVEDYLKGVLLLEQASPGAPVSTGRLATALSVTPGTATSMVKTLAASGLVEYEPYSGVHLSDAGRRLALHVLRRHRLIELFLVQVVGMDWSEVHAEAEQLEHAVSDRFIERIDEILGNPAVDPHGDPIPSAEGDVAVVDLPTLLDCALDRPVAVARVTDQDGDFLRLIDRHGLRPGAELTVVSREEAADAVALVSSNGTVFSLGFRAANKVLVRALGGAAESGDA